MDTAIEFQNVHKAFGDREVLQGIDLQVPRGQTTVILGSSGSGKSVLVSTVVGLLRPDQGRVVVGGQNVVDYEGAEDWQGLWLKTGFLFQGAALFDSMTVGENIAFPLRQHTELGEDAIEARVREVLSWIELEGAFGKMPSELSGGMQKRVGLGRTIVLEPEIVIYDEPTTGLDPLTSDTISDLIQRLKSERAVTSIVVTHDVRCAFQVADRAAMIDEGKILAEGTLEEIRNSSVPKLRSFLYG